jgi:hypothetical protein
LYLLVAASAIMLLMSFVPDVDLKEDKGKATTPIA